MKKILHQTFVVLLVAVTAFATSAQEFSSGDLMYKIYGSNAWVTGLTSIARGKSNLAVVIPGKVTNDATGTTYRVNGINANAFTNCDKVISVEMRFGVGTIESSAFSGCTGITYVRLPSSLKHIYSNAFSGCTALRSVYWANFNFPQTIISNSFPSNSAMALYISTQSKKTADQFKAKTGFTQFATVQKSRYAYDCYIDDGGYYAMGYPDEEGISTVRKATLVGYSPSGGSLTENGTVYKPYSTFTPAGNLSFVLDTIGIDAFQGQTTLKTIDLTRASSLRYICTQSVGSGVDNVTRLVLPSSSFNFNTATFNGFTSLAAFELASGSTSFSIYSGCLYNSSKTTLWRVPKAKSGEMSYPSTLTTVWSASHAGCSNITSARLPYGVRNINYQAFLNTTSLDYVYIPSSVTSLSTDRVFSGTKSNNYIYCNMANPPTVTASNYFGNNSSMRLYVPYGKIDTYKNAGWTGFGAYNNSGVQAHDIYTSSIGYTVTSTASTTVNGTSYNGRVKVVCYGDPASNVTSINIPSSITYNSKTYAVTKIGEYAFKNHTTNFSVSGCANVDTVGYGAFQEQPITSFAFTHKMSYIQDYAFDGAGLTGTICLPYGIKKLDYYAFGHGKYERIVVPSSLTNHYGNWFTGTTTLKEIVWNCKFGYTYSGWNFTDVPSTCYFRVPTGYVNQFKQCSSISSRSSYVTAGAYDFAYNNGYTGSYFLTILSTSSTTYNGTTYAGKAKYVYHPNIQNNTSTNNYGFDTYEEDRTVANDVRKYLITEIGDSLLYGSKWTGGTIPPAVTRIGQSAFRNCSFATNNLVLPSGLTFIGHDAFYSSKITGELKVPTSVTTLEDYALCASTLSSIYFPDMDMPTMGTTVWSSSIGKVWVPNARAVTYLNKANAWGSSYGQKINVWLKPYAATQPFSSVVPTNLSGSNITAYYASNYDKSNTGKEVTLTKANQAPENTGLLLVDLSTTTEYRISRPSSSVSAPMTNYLIAAASPTNVYGQTVGYYWSDSGKKFVKPTSSYTTLGGSAYLKLSTSEASGKNEVYTSLYPKTNTNKRGDVNGDGEVGIDDVELVIKMMLDKAPKDYAKADLTGDNNIGIDDVNAIINIMLDK